MPRKARNLVKNGCYHVITRGIDQMETFHCDEDRRKYLHLLHKYKRKYKFKLYAWCPMPNHVHLMISSDKLSKAMQCINLSYSQYHNHKYDRKGYLWQDRYKSYSIEKDKYFANVLQYIEYNPVRARIVENPEDYPWSSYRARVLGKDDFGLLDPIDF